MIAPRLATEASEPFEHRHERLSGPVLLDALASGEPDGSACSRPLQERLDEGGLSDPGIAGDADDLEVTGDGTLEMAVESLQLRVATDDREARARARGTFITADGRDEPVAAAMDGLHEPRRPRAVSERIAQLAHADGEDDLADGDVGPHRAEELLLRDQLARTQGEVVQNPERPLAERDDLALAQKAALDCVQDERREAERLRRPRAVGSPRHCGGRLEPARGICRQPVTRRGFTTGRGWPQTQIE